MPCNILAIGTMNLADRSIAMLHAAVPRRFAFTGLRPERVSVRGVMASLAATKDLRDDRADLLM